MRTYSWGFDEGPRFSVDVPDDSELVTASTTYEDLLHPSGKRIHQKILTVKLYFLDAEDIEDADEAKAILTVIGDDSA